MVLEWEPLRERGGKSTYSYVEAEFSLRLIVDDAFSKLALRNTRNNERLKWSRIVIEASKAWASLYEVQKSEDLEERIRLLEEERKNEKGES